MCAALTASLDKTVSDLVAPGTTPMAVVALGGYGRGELSPYSDVDLMLLHDGGDAAAAAADLFRPLWDAKLRVGHSVRTVREASEAARERFDTQTTLLTSRLVAGSEELFEQLMGAVTRVTRARPLRRYLVEAERTRRAEAPYRLMAVDIKTGRGGLRALAGFRVGASAPGADRQVLHAVSARGRTSARGPPTGSQCTPCRHRQAHDVFSPELREPVARWLGQRHIRDGGRPGGRHAVDRPSRRAQMARDRGRATGACGPTGLVPDRRSDRVGQIRLTADDRRSRPTPGER